jgi:hypothetical protein
MEKHLKKPAIYVPNLLVLILASTQIILKIKYDRENNFEKKQ